MQKLRIAVSGCSHGEMDTIYRTLSNMEDTLGYKADLLICCGDYQAIRNYGDLHQMAVPDKYKQLQTFYKYYSGESEVPLLTIVIGGNHESSGYLAEMPYGGWLAPNIYYMGYAGVVRFAGLRIAALSGIYKSQDYNKGHFEAPPFTENTKRSAYHVRSFDVFRLKQLKTKNADNSDSEGKMAVEAEKSDEDGLDIFVSHDWPRGVADYGDVQTLLRRKPFFREDIQRNQLGNPATMNLLQELKPRYWFSAHLHVHFEANVDRADGSQTKFIAFDKPLPGRKFLDIIEIDVKTSNSTDTKCLFYDLPWLSVLRSTNNLNCLQNVNNYMPGPGGPDEERYDFRPTKTEMDQVKSDFCNDFKIPCNFRPTAPYHVSGDSLRRCRPSLYYRNPQTTEFCQKMNILNLNEVFCERNPNFVGTPYYLSVSECAETLGTSNPDEIDIAENEAAPCGGLVQILDGDISLDTRPLTCTDSLQHFSPPALKRPSTDKVDSQLTTVAVKMKRRNQAIYEQDPSQLDFSDY